MKKKLVAKMSGIKKMEPTKRNRFFSEDEIEKLCAFGRERYGQMPIEERFEYELRNAFITVQYELALRSGETANIAWEDFQNAEDNGDGIITIKIRHGKWRKSDESDAIPVVYSRLKPTLELWKGISEEYCKKYGINPLEIKDSGKKYHPIFFNSKGQQLASNICTNIVKKQCKFAGIELNRGESSPHLRLARITHLLNKEMPIDLLRSFARHREKEMRRRFCIDPLVHLIRWFKADGLLHHSRKQVHRVE